MNGPQNPTQKLLLGVTGGIAAYKSPEIIRRLQELNFDVRVVMTTAAEKFIGEVTLQAISGHPVYKDMFISDDRVMEHIDLARWADKILVVPCSADFMAKLAHGFADDLLSTLCLAAECPIILAPAMNQAMWRNAATQNNFNTLKSRNIEFLGPASGNQACGEIGKGRLLDVDLLVSALDSRHKLLQGKKVLITAGPTQEALDPVRFVTNHSSGKMGYALATQAQQAGAAVTLISGPVQLSKPNQVNVISVTSTHQMYDAVMKYTEKVDIFISAAAVADYSPINMAEQKIKKNAEHLNIELKKNPDILASVASLQNRPFCVGFAAETENLTDNAKAKLLKKNLDMIIANYVGKTGESEYKGFHSDNNTVHIFTASESYKLPEQNKSTLAKQIIELIVKTYEEKHPS